MLILPEALLLLALDDEKGTAGWQSYDELNLGLAGALLAELTLRGRLRVTGTAVAVVDPLPTGDALLDEALMLVDGSTRQRDTAGWVRELHGKLKRLRDRVCEGLVEQGVLRREEHATLLVFHSARFPAADPTPEAALRERIRAAVSAEAAAPDERDLLCISLALACGAFDALCEKPERKAARARAAALTANEPWGAAVAKAIARRRGEITAATTIAATS